MSLNQSQYNEIMREYSKKQLIVTSECQKRRQLIYENIPELVNIEDEIAATSIAYARAKLFSPEEATDIHTSLSNLRQEKEDALAARGYSTSDLEPSYFCLDCKDTGYIDNTKCHCFKQAENALIYKQSNLNSRNEDETFDNFDLSFYSQEPTPQDNMSPYEYAQKALQESINFVNNFSSESSNLLIMGEAGVGKTFLCNCIAKDLLAQGHSVVYLTAKELFDIINKSVFDKDIEAKASVENLYSCDLLIIDDLGTEYANSFTSSQMYFIINERLLANRATVISTNLSIQDIQDTYTERVSSRIVGNYTVLKLLGQDIRLAKRFK